MTIQSSIDLFSSSQQPARKTASAARDFEGLLLAQILKSSHAEKDDDDAGTAAIGFGEEQLARSMAASGGIGLARMIEKGLNQAAAGANSAASSSE